MAPAVTTATQIQPTEDRVAIREDEAEDTYKPGGMIHIPEAAKEKPTLGTVVAVGPGRRNEHTGEREPMRLSVGDHVLYGKWSGTAVELAGEEELLVIRERDVFAVLEEGGS